jgi:hypothetical protein
LKQYIEDHHCITLPSLPASFNSELWTKKWDLTLKSVNSEPEFAVYARLAKTATRSLKTAQKLERTAHTRNRQLEMAREKFKEAQSGSNAKLVSIDVEAYELDHNCTTELGISVMVFPGGEIQSKHLLILEYAHLRNTKFVPDMSTAFGHGTSEWVHLRQCAGYIAEAFRAEGGPVYFIGHDPMADIKYLEKNLKCPFPKGMVVFDTRLMYSAFGGDGTLRKLSDCLDGLGVEYWNLHNAGTLSLNRLMVGNDAYYTLVAFKDMCLRDSTAEPVQEEKPTRFVIRDIVPEDLVVKPAGAAPPTASTKDPDVRYDLAAFLSGGNTHKNVSSKEGRPPARKYFSAHKPPAAAAHIDSPDIYENTLCPKTIISDPPPVPVKHDVIATGPPQEAPPSKLTSTSPKYIPPHKFVPLNATAKYTPPHKFGVKATKSTPFSVVVEEFPPLPPSQPAPIVPANKRRRSPTSTRETGVSDEMLSAKNGPDRAMSAADGRWFKRSEKGPAIPSAGVVSVVHDAVHDAGDMIRMTDKKHDVEEKSTTSAGEMGSEYVVVKSSETDPMSTSVELGTSRRSCDLC